MPSCAQHSRYSYCTKEGRSSERCRVLLKVTQPDTSRTSRCNSANCPQVLQKSPHRYFQPGALWPPGDIWQCLEVLQVIMLGGCYWYLMGEVRDAARHPIIHRRSPHQKINQPPKATVPRVRILDAGGFYFSSHLSTLIISPKHHGDTSEAQVVREQILFYYKHILL